ncbi:MAG TPA: hypothetical protein VES21_13365 [Nocardioidaceae bacterium]|nr:hypothetical protein [Nocardioidaceae bacterium]
MTNPSGQVESVKDTRERTRNPALLIAHTTVVLLLTAFFIAAYMDNPGAENIGAGMAWLMLGTLGLPWSIIYAFTGLNGQAGDSIYVIAAMVNVGLHTAWYLRHR